MNLLSSETSGRLAEMLSWWQRNRSKTGRGPGDSVPPIPDTVPVNNSEASAAPAYSLALLGTQDPDTGEYAISQATTAEDTPLVVLCGEAPASGPSRAWLDFKPHPLAVADNSAMTAGDRLGVDTGVSWNAVADDFGPFQIVSVPTDSTTYVIAVRLAASAADPYLYKVTGTGTGTVDVKKVDNSGAATGDAITVIDGSSWT